MFCSFLLTFAAIPTRITTAGEALVLIIIQFSVAFPLSIQHVDASPRCILGSSARTSFPSWEVIPHHAAAPTWISGSVEPCIFVTHIVRDLNIYICDQVQVVEPPALRQQLTAGSAAFNPPTWAGQQGMAVKSRWRSCFDLTQVFCALVCTCVCACVCVCVCACVCMCIFCVVECLATVIRWVDPRTHAYTHAHKRMHTHARTQKCDVA